MSIFFVFRRLSLTIPGKSLSHQLRGVTLPRLRHLEITGPALTTLDPLALTGLNNCRELVFELRGTQVS